MLAHLRRVTLVPGVDRATNASSRIWRLLRPVPIGDPSASHAPSVRLAKLGRAAGARPARTSVVWLILGTTSPLQHWLASEPLRNVRC